MAEILLDRGTSPQNVARVVRFTLDARGEARSSLSSRILAYVLPLVRSSHIPSTKELTMPCSLWHELSSYSPSSLLSSGIPSSEHNEPLPLVSLGHWWLSTRWPRSVPLTLLGTTNVNFIGAAEWDAVP
jgi:hypothetical protein